MKLQLTRIFMVLFLLASGTSLFAQKAKSTVKKKEYPASFVISKQEFEGLFAKKQAEVISSKTNKYLDKSNVLMNTLNGDMKFMKIKLNYFANAFLMIQVNGVYSTQVFVLSDDKSVFYKGSVDNGRVTMTKCDEDEIVSE